MRFLIIFLPLFIFRDSFSQEKFIYRDTVNNFSICIPQNWTYQTDNENPGIKLTVYGPIDRLSNKRESYNVNIVPLPNSNIDSAYSAMVQSISKRQGYKFVSEGDTIVESKKYKWLIQQHINTVNKEPMTAFIYLGYQNDKAYMVTFASGTSPFEYYETLFRKLSATFRI